MNKAWFRQAGKALERLFADRTEYEKFTERHAKNHVKRTDLSTYQGDCFIGFDAGSTTTKAALVAEDGSLLYSFYSINYKFFIYIFRKIDFFYYFIF